MLLLLLLLPRRYIPLRLKRAIAAFLNFMLYTYAASAAGPRRYIPLRLKLKERRLLRLLLTYAAAAAACPQVHPAAVEA
jgi:hypothetical protein